MDVVPLIMRYIRIEMRSHGVAGLSIPHFRALIFLYRNESASLSQVADDIGLTLSSASRIIDLLASRKLVIRKVLADDRRFVSLKLTRRGQAALQRARRGTEAHLGEKIAALSATQQAMVAEAMQTIRPLFAATRRSASDKSG
jgi:DNA-binding MarR family transcriptional regulator